MTSQNDGELCTANGWENSSFSCTANKQRFLRLMGAKGHVPQADSSSAIHEANPSMDKQLETQYWQGMRQGMFGRGRGLGAI